MKNGQIGREVKHWYEPFFSFSLTLATHVFLNRSKHTARRAVTAAQTERESMQAAARARVAERQAAALKREADEIARRLDQLSMRHAEDEERLGSNWSDQQKIRRAHTEHIIQSEEEKLRARQAEERRAQVEAERLRKEAEAKAAAAELRKKEEAAKAAQEAEEAKARVDREEAARKEAEKLELAKAQALDAQSQERDALGMTTPDQDWREARLALKVRFSALHSITITLSQHADIAATQVGTDRARQG